MKKLIIFFLIFLVGCASQEAVKITVTPTGTVTYSQENVNNQTNTGDYNLEILKLDKIQENIPSLKVTDDFKVCWTGITSEEYEVLIENTIEGKEIYREITKDTCFEYDKKLDVDNYFLTIYAKTPEDIIGKVSAVIMTR